VTEDVLLADKLVQKAWAHSCRKRRRERPNLRVQCVTVASKKALLGHGRMIARGCETCDGWDIVDAVKRHVLRFVLFFFSVLAASGQSPALGGELSTWVNYLDGSALDGARQAVTTVETGVEAWLAAKIERTGQLQTLYVSARRESWSEAEYRRRLEAAGFATAADAAESGEAQALAAIQAALGTLGTALKEQPPNAGSISARDAVRWLRAAGEILGARMDAASDLIGVVQSQGQNASNAAAEAFLTSIDLPMPAGFGDASVQDQLFQVAEHWWLLFLAATDDDERAQMISRLGAATRSFPAEVSARATDLAGQYRAAAVQVRRLKQVVAAALPSVGARTVVALGTPGSAAPGKESLGLLLTELQGASREHLFMAATADAATHFTIGVTERMLVALSDRQAFEVGRVAGLGIGDLRMIAGRLYRVRLDLAETDLGAAADAAGVAADRYRRSDLYQDQALLLRAHTEDARSYLAGLDLWVSGGQSRSGESYRWALLSVISNRYAHHLLLTDPARPEAQRLVGEFASDLYEGTVQRLPDGVAERLQRDSTIEVADSFDRGYRLEPLEAIDESEDEYDVGAELESIYRSFVSEAQGDGGINEIFGSSPGSVPSMASDWAHTHGFHVSVSGPNARPLRDAALVWFNLANNADNDLRGFAHAIRGVLALASAMESLLQPALRGSGEPAVQIYAPRLALARDHLATAQRFEVSPGETLAVLHGLYPEAGEIEALIGEMERSVETLGDRLADVEAADRRIIQTASGER